MAVVSAFIFEDSGNIVHLEQHVADRFAIPFHHFPITQENKQEKREIELLRAHGVDIIVLARAVWWHLQRRVLAYRNRTGVFG